MTADDKNLSPAELAKKREEQLREAMAHLLPKTFQADDPVRLDDAFKGWQIDHPKAHVTERLLAYSAHLNTKCYDETQKHSYVLQIWYYEEP
ncbi:MAG: hypothetical protein Q7R83_00930 [bacterium]|nr:hypothetical protein [bacterium]